MPISEIVDKAMPSLTEWLEKINHRSAEAFRLEDNTKRDRMEILYQTIGFNYDRPERMTARDIVDKTPLFTDILNRKGNEKCALRLVPTKPELPKLRVRGKTLHENLIWFHEQNIDPDVYRVEVVPHPSDSRWSAIFLVTDAGVLGELTPGLHWQLTQGMYEKPPINFFFDYHNWQFSESNQDALATMREALEALHVTDPSIRTKLKDKLNAEFTARGYLKGYFEFAVPDPHYRVEFIDYNRFLYTLLADDVAAPKSEIGSTELTGTIASRGQARGRVRLVLDPANTEFVDGEILLCPMTTVDYVPLMQRAAAIVTEQGTILSHAAIVSRELGKPCLVGVKNAMTLLKNGDQIEVDAINGRILPLDQTNTTSTHEPTFVRPSWDEYFMEIARAVAKRATCDRGRSGCVIARDKQILVTGYVGSAAGLQHCDEIGHQMKTVIHEDGHESQHCVRTAHAEQNAIVQAAKLGIGIDKGTIYSKMTPCAACCRMIINAGIKRVVCEKRYHAGQESEEMFRKVGIELDYFNEDVEHYANQ